MLLKRSLTLGVLSLILSVSFAPQAKADIELGKALKEIFVKGSLDGEKLFLVLGMEKASEIFGTSMREAIDVEELKDWGSDAARAIRNQSNRVWNSEHDGDTVDHLGRATRLSVETADDIFKWPWRSLKKIPGSFKVGMNDAREARANANNGISGTVAFSGLATWTVVKGAYYLVIEAPVKFVAALATTTLAVPATLAYEALRIPLAITFGVAANVVRLGWVASKAIVMGSVALGAISYSALSTGVAMAATTIAAAAVGAFRVTAALVKMPFRFFKKGTVKVSTTIKYDRMTELAEALPGLLASDILAKLGVDSDLTVGEVRVEDYKSVITYRSKLNADKEALVIRVGIDFNSDKDNQFLNIEAYMKNGHFKALKEVTDLSSRKLKKVIESNLENLLGEALLIFQGDDVKDIKSNELAMAI